MKITLRNYVEGKNRNNAEGRNRNISPLILEQFRARITGNLALYYLRTLFVKRYHYSDDFPKLKKYDVSGRRGSFFDVYEAHLFYHKLKCKESTIFGICLDLQGIREYVLQDDEFAETANAFINHPWDFRKREYLTKPKDILFINDTLDYTISGLMGELAKRNEFRSMNYKPLERI